ncbi:PEP/pyruvate-binding domain-containing protein [Motiliproteus sediminis]|uniref:PEP/pyruvate-binding domain-containing protein n=1 Tax=Motiliproteus sediminis TaxID=1468178 RepID=UPI001AEFF9EF|nr:PEP/pyruvate-binding domain-containing protein [Motiliproteus sediminis]
MPLTRVQTRTVEATATPVLWLDQITPEHQPVVGAKAFTLGLLRQQGLPVPPGFCLTCDALTMLSDSSAPAQLPAELETLLLDAWHQLDGAPVAVRSSALEEDQADASWAGMFATHLSITSPAQLFEAVLDCWRSLHRPAVVQLRAQQRRHQQPAPAPRIAILVQQQVDASAAGVLFTRDPLHPRAEQLCVNAVQGLGEPLVSGLERGDRYQLSRRGELISQHLHPQQRRLSLAGEHPLPPERGGRSSLTPAQLWQLASLGVTLEASLGSAQDIEFAFDGDQLWLLQSRPVVCNRAPDRDALIRYRNTELHALKRKLDQLTEHRILRHGRGVLSNGNIGELLPLPTPMSFALFQHIFTGDGGAIPRGRKALGYEISPRANRELFTLIAGQPYFHLELDARSYDLRQPQPVALYLDAVRADPARANYPEFGLYHQYLEAGEATALFGEQSGMLFARECRRHQDALQRFGRDYYGRFRRRIEPQLERHRLSMERCTPGDTSQALLIRVSALIQHLQQVSCYHFVIAARLGFYFAERLRQALQQYLPHQTDTLMGQLLQALPGSRITEQMLDLGALQRGELERTQFVRRYGHLAVTELEIAQPRYHEDPEQLQRLTAIPGERADSRSRFRQQWCQRKGVERQLRQQLRLAGVSAADQQQLFLHLRLARRYLPLRETIKYHFAGEYDLLRRALLAYADSTGLARDDLFYLEPAELPLAINRRGEAERLIDQRRQQHRLAKNLAAARPLPAVIFGDDPDAAFNQPPSSGGNRWQGEGIAPGIRRGRLRLVDENSDLCALARSLHPDDILVTRSANLGLAPLLRSVAGLVVEIGGFLAHAACQAREAGIPAMVLPDATRLLQEGSEALLDGDGGSLLLTS